MRDAKYIQSIQSTQGISSLSQSHGLKILVSLDRTRGAFELTSIGSILRYHIKIFFLPKWRIKTETAERAEQRLKRIETAAMCEIEPFCWTQLPLGAKKT